jgi:hypothetical protein
MRDSGAASRVKRYDEEIRTNDARRKRQRCGRSSSFSADVGEQIEAVFDEDEFTTFKQAADALGMPVSTLHNYATEELGYRCLAEKVRPKASEKNLEDRVKMAQDISNQSDGDDCVPFTDEFHQDEKWFYVHSRRRKRKVKRGDVPRETAVTNEASRTHGTKVMFSGCTGVGPTGEPMHIDFQWISEEKTAKRKSKNHAKGDVYRVPATMNAAYFERVMRDCGRAIRARYAELGFPNRRVKLQIDSAGGHGMARGVKVFTALKEMMDRDYNVELVQQPGNSPMTNILDLTIWQAVQLEVDNMRKETRHQVDALVETCDKAWDKMPTVKVLRAFEMRRDVAAEMLRNNGACPTEGKGGGGAHRVHVHPSYAALRARLGILTDAW